MTLSPRPWKILDKRGLIIAAMERLAGEAHISLEGNLRNLRFNHISGASEAETEILRRNTLWPKQDFVVLPLNSAFVPEIGRAIGGTLPRTILHIQIESGGALELGLYDNFQASGFGAALDETFFNELQLQGVVRPRTA